MFDFRAKLSEFRLMTVTGVNVDIDDSTKHVEYLYINKENLTVKIKTSEYCEDLNFEFYSLNEENEFNKDDIPEEGYTKGIGVNVMDLVDVHEPIAAVNDEDAYPVTLESLFNSVRNSNLSITYNSKTLDKHKKTTEKFTLELEHEVMNVFNDFKNKKAEYISAFLFSLRLRF